MSMLIDEAQVSNQRLRLGDSWKLGPNHQLDPERLDYQAENATGHPAELLRPFNVLFKRDYQRAVTETDYGTPRCIHCLGENKAKERNQGKSVHLNEPIPSSAPVGNYVYKPLPNPEAIRVLELFPALASDAPLRATLTIWSSKDSTSYVALSYTWSGVSTIDTIDLGAGNLEITGNLELALRALRPTNSALRIWVDAICIDQMNLSEKAVQVARMDQIYSEAEAVVAWLGPETENSLDALESMERLAELSKMPEYDIYVAPRPIARELYPFGMDGEVAKQVQVIRTSAGIKDVIERLWFTRLWVVQEVILAKDINLHIGRSSITWQKFRRAIKMLWNAESQFVSMSRDPNSRDPDKNNPIMYAATLVDSRDKMKSMEDGNMLMRDYTNQVFGKARDLRNWGCKDPRDRVFAILGFVPKDSDIHITPDYTAKTRQVYINFARQHILKEGLLILLYAGLEARAGRGLAELANRFQEETTLDFPDLETLGLPSWIPDLRPNQESQTIRQWSAMDFEAAMNQAPASVLHKQCPHILAVKGCVFDAIIQPLPTSIIHPDSTEIMDFVEAIKYITFVYRFARDHYQERGGYPTGEDFSTVFNSVVTAGKMSMKIRRLAQERDQEWIDRNLELPKLASEEGFGSVIRMLEAPGKLMDIAMFFSCLSLLFHVDQCIFTEQGYMGLAPNCSKLDKIAWINGLQCPVILRPVLDGQQYQLIGPCFLHGVMHGELAAMGGDEEKCSFIELI